MKRDIFIARYLFCPTGERMKGSIGFEFFALSTKNDLAGSFIHELPKADYF